MTASACTPVAMRGALGAVCRFPGQAIGSGSRDCILMRWFAGRASFKSPTSSTTRDTGSGNPGKRALAKLGRGSHSLGVPRLREGTSLLAHSLTRSSEVRPFTDKHIALLQHFAGQAVIAIENVRLLNELRERTADLYKSLAAADRDRGRAQGHQPLDLRSPAVLDTLVESAARLCEADHGGLFQMRGRDAFCGRAAIRLFSSEIVEQYASHISAQPDGAAAGRSHWKAGQCISPMFWPIPNTTRDGYQQKLGSPEPCLAFRCCERECRSGLSFWHAHSGSHSPTSKSSW